MDYYGVQQRPQSTTRQKRLAHIHMNTSYYIVNMIETLDPKTSYSSMARAVVLYTTELGSKPSMRTVSLIS